MKVGVFDSGIGGLTVLERLIKNYPNNEYVYFGDTLNLPYGNKSLDELRSYADKIINFLINAKVDIIVIACGTISSNLYNEIKEKYSIPIIDVLTPTFKFIIDNNLEGVVVFATQMTINSGAFDKVSNRTIACPLFVPLIEKGKINSNECVEVIQNYLKEIGDVNYIVLGCTHYPLLSDIINKYSDAKLINMGDCVCEYRDFKGNGDLTVNLYFSLLSDELLHNISRILDVPYVIKEKFL